MYQRATRTRRRDDHPAAQATTALRPPTLTAGRPLEPTTRDAAETAFGFDFSRVRIHSDAEAAEAAQALDAHAFTYADHVFFADGEYAPDTARGGWLLSHELAHVVQQDGAPQPSERSPWIAGAADPIETAADAAADAVLLGTTPSVAAGSATSAGPALADKKKLLNDPDVQPLDPIKPPETEPEKRPKRELKKFGEESKPPEDKGILETIKDWWKGLNILGD